jgi:glycyl-tRNA synthetase alpha subunit
MELSQFTYLQHVVGIECAPVSGDLTYGLKRLAMYVQGLDNVYDLNFNGREGAEKVTYDDASGRPRRSIAGWLSRTLSRSPSISDFEVDLGL